MIEKFVAFFGHFYQPPRFNPWTEHVDLDPTAYPFHDWNERVDSECYSVNAWIPVYGVDGWVEGVVSNYSRINFSFGPILLTWLREKRPEVFKAIVEADAESISRYGRGVAIAQPYAHIIMPLAPRLYRELSVYWGVRFFEDTFGRPPEGFWLPEAAVDYETLEILVDNGVKFVILAPHQISTVKVGGRWLEYSKADPRVAYRISLPSGRSLAAVVYDEGISRELSFGDLLEDGGKLASRILGSYNELLQEPQIITVASDGEVFGHHKKNGARELAKALDIIDSSGEARLTSIARFLEVNPPRIKAKIAANTSWSCPHGVERWKSECGCASEIRPGWRQDWRAPLRKAIDMLSLETLKAYEELGPTLFKDHYRALQDYYMVVSLRSPGVLAGFLEFHLKDRDVESSIKALKILEAVRHSLLSQSSDAWFFEDLGRPEPFQVLRHAARTVELLKELGYDSVEEAFTSLIGEASSNTGERGTIIYRRAIGHRVDLLKAAAIYAVRRSIGLAGKEMTLYSFSFSETRRDSFRELHLGIVNALSLTTMDQATIHYALIKLGPTDIYVGTGFLDKPEVYINLLRKTVRALEEGSQAKLLNTLEEAFQPSIYTLQELPADEQALVAEVAASEALRSLAPPIDSWLQSLTSIVKFYRLRRLPEPEELKATLSHTLNTRLLEELFRPSPDWARIRGCLKLVENLGLTLYPDVKTVLAAKIAKTINNLYRDPQDTSTLTALHDTVEASLSAGLSLEDLSSARVLMAVLKRRYYSDFKRAAEAGDEAMWRWVKAFANLSEILKVRA